ncbi:hypothetical protein ES703_99350 [subsurface metagenome]
MVWALLQLFQMLMVILLKAILTMYSAGPPVAYTPGMVNLLVVGVVGNTLVIPKPFGPRNPTDVLEINSAALQ